MDNKIDINAIPKSPRYIYTVEYIFPNPYQSASAFIKTNDRTHFHIQEFYEICVISRGKGHHAIENTIVEAKRGDVFIIPPGRRHAILGGDGFDVHYIHLHPEFIRTYSPRMRLLPAFLSLFEIEPMMRVNGNTYRHLYLDDDVLAEVIKLIENLVGRWQYDMASKLIFESNMLVILTIFCREYEKMQNKVGINASIDKPFMDSISYIIEHHGRKITIDELAKMSTLSRTSYIKRFREVTGKSPNEFITSTRITEAKNMLIGSGKSISKIAEECGFYDASHFTKAFVASVGESPSEYRARYETKK